MKSLAKKLGRTLVALALLGVITVVSVLLVNKIRNGKELYVLRSLVKQDITVFIGSESSKGGRRLIARVHEVDFKTVYKQNTIYFPVLGRVCFSGVTELSALDTENSLRNLDQFAEFSYLEKLRVASRSLKTLSFDSISNLKNLRELAVTDCVSLESLAGIGQIHGLTRLEIGNGLQVRDVDQISLLKNLEFLELYRTQSVEDLSFLKELTKLKQLQIAGCPRLLSTAGIQGKPNLSGVVFQSCYSLTKLDGLDELPGLKELYLHGLDSLPSLETMGRLNSCEKLSIIDCDNLTNIEAVFTFPALNKLKISGSEGIPKKQINAARVFNNKRLTGKSFVP